MPGNNPSHGTKVTDPNATLRESAGPVASDSLAAESETFSSENRNGAAQGVSGTSSTFANTNTSGATRLDPAIDSEARKAEEDWSKEQQNGNDGTAYPTAAGGQNKGLAGEDTTRGQYQTSSDASGNGGTAPSYVISQYVSFSRPKGANLTEGGFESDDTKNASFTSEIGSKNDPGRLAELKIQRQNADSARDAALPRQKGITGDNPFDALSGDTNA